MQAHTQTTTPAHLYHALKNETGKLHSPHQVNVNAGSPLELACLAMLRLTRLGGSEDGLCHPTQN